MWWRSTFNFLTGTSTTAKRSPLSHPVKLCFLSLTRALFRRAQRPALVFHPQPTAPTPATCSARRNPGLTRSPSLNSNDHRSTTGRGTLRQEHKISLVAVIQTVAIPHHERPRQVSQRLPSHVSLRKLTKPYRAIAQLRACRPIPEVQVRELCYKARELLIEEGNVVGVDAPVTVWTHKGDSQLQRSKISADCGIPDMRRHTRPVSRSHGALSRGWRRAGDELSLHG
jgi:hypothetical protein